MMVTADRKQNIFQSPFDISDPLINFSDVFRGEVEEGAGVPCLPVREGRLPTLPVPVRPHGQYYCPLMELTLCRLRAGGRVLPKRTKLIKTVERFPLGAFINSKT